MASMNPATSSTDSLDFRRPEILGGPYVTTLRQSGQAMHWIREALAHCKVIGATRSAIEFVKDACSGISQVRLSSTGVVESYGVVTSGGLTPADTGEAVTTVEKRGDFFGQSSSVTGETS